MNIPNIESIKSYVISAQSSKKPSLNETPGDISGRRDSFTKSNFSNDPHEAWSQMEKSGMDLRGTWAFVHGRWEQTEKPAFTLEEVEVWQNQLLDLADWNAPGEAERIQEYKRSLGYVETQQEAEKALDRFVSYRNVLGVSDYYQKLKDSLRAEVSKHQASDGSINRRDVTGIIYTELSGQASSVGGSDRDVRTFLANYGVPDDITFSVDYDNNRRTFELTEISDETYRSQVETALDKAFSMGSIFNVTRKAAFLAGNAEEYFYSYMADSLRDAFGQDIKDLWIDDNGNIQGTNAALQSALKREADGQLGLLGMHEHNGMQFKNIGDGLRQLLSMPECHESITKMVFDENGLYYEAGELQMGRTVYADIENDERLINLYYNVSSRDSSYETWLSDYNAFK